LRARGVLPDQPAVVLHGVPEVGSLASIVGEGIAQGREPGHAEAGRSLSGEFQHKGPSRGARRERRPHNVFPQSPFWPRLLELLCVADLLLYTPAVLLLVFAAGDLAASSHTRWGIILILMKSEVSVLTRAICMCMVLRGTRLGNEFRHCVINPRAAIIHGFVMLDLSMVCLLEAAPYLQFRFPMWQLVALGTALGYNVLVLLCHAAWLCHLRGPQPSTKLLLKASETKPFGQVDEGMMARNKECCICLDDFAEVDAVMVLPCGHVLHDACGRRWVKSDHICPYRCLPPEP